MNHAYERFRFEQLILDILHLPDPLSEPIDMASAIAEQVLLLKYGQIVHFMEYRKQERYNRCADALHIEGGIAKREPDYLYSNRG